MATTSGSALIRSFCNTCGSSVFLAKDDGTFTIVALGTLDNEVDWGE